MRICVKAELTAFSFVGVGSRIESSFGTDDGGGGPVERVDVAQFRVSINSNSATLDFSQRYEPEKPQIRLVYRYRQMKLPIQH